MPPDTIELRLGPFVESGRSITNVGYRDVLTGQIVSSVEIPSELIERAVLNAVSVEIGFSADGQISSAANGSASCSSKKMIHIDELVETFLASDNLHMEEVTVWDLKRLLEKLEKAARAVKQSITSLEQVSN
ncbi:hypothetical protein [Bradyrhizobium sp. ARR65]|uniref:hypothetical protein n=1 Tax=Bradyrhizobium sp. ARR65 TaxID=1040989 RepID=UPI0004678065|nr:hypothetical protein [Bradyrhizobium sp. ARR65]